MGFRRVLFRSRSLDDGDVIVAAGEEGEICLRGPQVMAGYWQKPQETAAALRDGWLHTGDVGTMDADGYFYLVDRLKEVLVTGAYKVYPRRERKRVALGKRAAIRATLGGG